MIAQIAAHSPENAEWVRQLVEGADPVGQRNAAIRAAAALLRESTPTRTAKRIEEELRRYLATRWLRNDRDRSSPAAGASPIRIALWRIARLTNGAGVGWRTIYDVLDARP